MLKEWSDKPTKGSKEMKEWDIYKQTRKFSNRCKKKKKLGSNEGYFS